jgi:hypothetical protein
MVAKCTRACLAVALAVTAAGCPRPGSQPSGPVTTVQPSGPSIKKLPEAAALLEELIGVDAYVYEFSGSFLEVWLETEVEDVATKERQTQSTENWFPTDVSRDDFKNRTGPIADQVRGKIVLWGDPGSALSLRITGEVPGKKPAPGAVNREGTTGTSSTFSERNVRIPEIPGTPIEGKGGVGFGGGGAYAPDVIKLPAKVGEPFTIVRYEREKDQWKMEVKPPERTVLGKLTVRLQGRLLAEEVPAYRDQPDDSAAVAALVKVGADFEKYDTGSVRNVSFRRSSYITDDDLAYLKKLPNLKELSLPDTITDNGLAHVGQLTELRVLFLQGPRITDAGLRHLKGLNRLEFLSLTGTQVTDEGKAELQAALPKAHILLHKPKPPTPGP